MVAVVQVSEHFEWRESDDTLKDMRTDERRAASCFAAKVDVFEDRVRGWFLDVAGGLLVTAPAPGDYVAVSILLAYAEGVEQFRQGRNTPSRKAGEWFRASLKRILGTTDDDLVMAVWKRGRSGLFHDLFTKDRTVLSRDAGEAAKVIEGVLRINPVALAKLVDSDFAQYVAQLRQHPGGDLSTKFQRLWDARWEDS